MLLKMKGFFLALCLTLLLFATVSGFLLVDYNTSRVGFKGERESVIDKASGVELDTENIANQIIIFVPSKLRLIADGAFRLKKSSEELYKKIKSLLIDPKKKNLGDSLFIKTDPFLVFN